MARPRTEKISEHFLWGEVYCKCGCEFPKDLEANAIKAAQMAEGVRAYLGHQAMKVNSWYRCPAYQKIVNPEATNSYHPKALAIDFVVKRLPPATVQEWLQKKRELVGGLGRYPGFTHIDQGPVRNW